MHFDIGNRRGIGWSAGIATLGLTCVAFAVPALSAGGTVRVGSLAVVSGTVTGSISGFQPDGAVTINGRSYLANPQGTVTLDGAPLGDSSALDIGYRNSSALAQTTRAPLVNAMSGLPLSLAQLNDAVPDLTAPSDPSPASTGGTTTPSDGANGSAGSGGSSGTGGSTLTPQGALLIPGAVRLRDGSISIPATSVVAPYRLVISKVSFAPRVIRTRQHMVTVRYRVTDTRGLLVRNAEVYMRSLPLRVITAGGTHRTSNTGWVSFRFKPTKQLTLQKGGRVNLFVRAVTPGTSKIGGTSTRRLVSLGISPSSSS